MAKEIIRSSQLNRARRITEDTELELSPEQNQELSSIYAGAVDEFKRGKIIKGTIVAIRPDGVLVDIHYKSDGLIPRYEFSDHELKRFAPGSEIEVILDELENSEGNVILSYEQAKTMRAWDIISKLFEENKPVEGVVTHKVKGGLNVDIGLPAFLPGSQIDIQRVVDFDQFVGQSITANILKINKKRGNVILSRRKFLTDQRSESRKKILDTLSVNQIIQGTVKNITNYGVFIDIGGVDGLLHITDMTWGRISHPSELVKIGDIVTVKVLSFDKDNEKISLGMKQLADNPWVKLDESVKIGSVIKGTISSITDYGLFVEVQKGIEGLVHISEISWTDRITDLHKNFKVGEQIDVMVVSLDKENRRMSLSIKQLHKNPWASLSEQFKIGQKVNGSISNITDFGIFVQIMPGIDGLVHISDLSWTEHIEHPGDRYTRGQEVEAIILNIDETSKKVSLGIKQLTQDPWVTLRETYPVGAIVEGKVSKITSFGAFVKLASGIEGLVHISELADHPVEKVEDVLKVGQAAQFRVINVNQEERKLGLSMKLEPSTRERDSKDETRARAPKKKDAKYEAPAQMQNKPKSMLQLELEKLARSRSSNDTDSSKE